MTQFEKDTIYIIIAVTFACIVLTVSGYALGRHSIKQQYKQKEVVEDSIGKVKLEIKHIDSLKNEEIINVQGLNNDSTLNLFKRLIGEE